MGLFDRIKGFFNKNKRLNEATYKNYNEFYNQNGTVQINNSNDVIELEDTNGFKYKISFQDIENRVLEDGSNINLQKARMYITNEKGTAINSLNGEELLLDPRQVADEKGNVYTNTKSYYDALIYDGGAQEVLEFFSKKGSNSNYIGSLGYPNKEHFYDMPENARINYENEYNRLKDQQTQERAMQNEYNRQDINSKNNRDYFEAMKETFGNDSILVARSNGDQNLLWFDEMVTANVPGFGQKTLQSVKSRSKETGEIKKFLVEPEYMQDENGNIQNVTLQKYKSLVENGGASYVKGLFYQVPDNENQKSGLYVGKIDFDENGTPKRTKDERFESIYSNVRLDFSRGSIRENGTGNMVYSDNLTKDSLFEGNDIDKIEMYKNSFQNSLRNQVYTNAEYAQNGQNMQDQRQNYKSRNEYNPFTK